MLKYNSVAEVAMEPKSTPAGFCVLFRGQIFMKNLTSNQSYFLFLAVAGVSVVFTKVIPWADY